MTDFLQSQSLLPTVRGIGVAAVDPAASDPRQDLGQNLLGQTLQKVRDLQKKQSFGRSDAFTPPVAPEPANSGIFDVIPSDARTPAGPRARRRVHIFGCGLVAR